MDHYKKNLLIDLYESIEREKYVHEEIEKLKIEDFGLREARALGVVHLSFLKPYHKQQQKTKMDGLLEEYRNLKKTQYEYVTRFGINEDTRVFDNEDVEALIFLKNAGWAGSAVIFREEFVSDLTENHIPFILSQHKPWSII